MFRNLKWLQQKRRHNQRQEQKQQQPQQSKKSAVEIPRNVERFSRGTMLKVRDAVTAVVVRKLLSGGVDHCVFGRLAVMVYGAPLAGHHENVIQLAVPDKALGTLVPNLFMCDQKLGQPVLMEKSRWGHGANGIFLECRGIQVEILPAYSMCRFPNGTFDRLVTTSEDSILPLPSLADLLVSLQLAVLEPNQEYIGRSFAGMLVDVYRLESEWIVQNVGPLDQEVGQHLVAGVEGQHRAYYRAKPTGWILHKFFTNGQPFEGPLYRTGINQKKTIEANWPPPRRQWKSFDHETHTGCGQSSGQSDARANSSDPVNRISDAIKKIDDDGGNLVQDTVSRPVAAGVVPRKFLLIAARKIESKLNESGIPMAFVGGFAMQQLGMSRETHDIDFVHNTDYLQLRNALQGDTMCTNVPNLVDGAFKCYCNVEDEETEYRVEVNGLDSNSFGGPRGGTLSKCSYKTDDWVTVLTPEELLVMKLEACRARKANRDAADIAYLVNNHHDEISYSRIKEEYKRKKEFLPDSLHSMFVEWEEAQGISRGFPLPGHLD